MRRAELISASAGSGKTHALTKALSELLAGGGGQAGPVRPEGVIAVTFTRKAAAELGERVRRRLIEGGHYDAAQRIELGLVGTVDSVCGRLVREYAFELGLSPDVETIPEDEADVAFAEAIAGLLEEEGPADLRPVLRRLGVESVQKDVATTATLARGNAMDAEAIAASAERSVEQVLSLLPERMTDEQGYELDRRLAASVVEALEALRASGNAQKNTQGAIGDLERFGGEFRNPAEATWYAWAKLTKLTPAKALTEMVQPVTSLAERHTAHPRFHDDLAAYVRGVFDLAQGAIREYRNWKSRNRLLDFVDLETLALDLLGLPGVEDELRDRFDVLMVDEFQDTNPIQLALFLRLGELAGRVVWVGDEKQAIYGFRGTDPELVQAVAQQVADPSKRRTLESSWRSRPALVRLTSSAFAKGFARDGIPREHVELKSERDDTAIAETPAVEWWMLATTNVVGDAAAVAARVRVVIDEGPLVEDRRSREGRGVEPGDIAVLCRSNKECERVAAALAAVGVPAAIAQPGLMRCAEARLATAALTLALEPRDSLAAAEVSLLCGYSGRTPDVWLEERIRQVASARELGGAWPLPFEHDAWVARVRAVVDDLRVLSPSEALDAVIRAVGLANHCLGWGDAAQRFANVEALRALALGYEDHCRYSRSAATVGGLLSYLHGLAEVAKDGQAEGVGRTAVRVLTYHRAKGLEWPVVVMASLEKGAVARIFEPTIEPPEEGFDATRPLEGRWIRFWPWPYGRLSSGLEYRDAAERHSSCESARRVTLAESRRLLYVGMTRARDQLVLVTREKRKASAPGWLADLEAGSEEPIFDLPGEADDGKWRPIVVDLEGASVEALVRRLSKEGHEVDVERVPEVWFARAGGTDASVAKPKLILGCSQAVLPEDLQFATRTGGIHQVSSPHRSAEGIEWVRVGSAVHLFLGADLVRPAADRIGHATAVLEAFELSDALGPEDCVDISDRLQAWLEETYPGARRLTEVPLVGAVATAAGPRTLLGTADLVLETADGLVLIDHKCYPPADEETVRRTAKSYAPQLLAYAVLLEMATSRTVIATLIHLPFEGKIVEVEADREAARALENHASLSA
jgi:ATP-dependent exoDNAse (exonuclease V) beta subunit